MIQNGYKYFKSFNVFQKLVLTPVVCYFFVSHFLLLVLNFGKKNVNTANLVQISTLPIIIMMIILFFRIRRAKADIFCCELSDTFACGNLGTSCVPCLLFSFLNENLSEWTFSFEENLYTWSYWGSRLKSFAIVY